MHPVRAILIFATVILLLSSTGCLDLFLEKPVSRQITAPLPAPAMTTENPRATVHASEMALQPGDLTTDFFLLDRSVVSYDQVGETNHELGWQQGYIATFFRTNPDYHEITRITQEIGIYPLGNMNTVFSVERESLLKDISTTNGYEIPFPLTGDRSIAIRVVGPDGTHDIVTYTVIFTRKNVFEKISITGSVVDYEILKDISGKAAGRIR